MPPPENCCEPTDRPRDAESALAQALREQAQQEQTPNVSEALQKRIAAESRGSGVGYVVVQVLLFGALLAAALVLLALIEDQTRGPLWSRRASSPIETFCNPSTGTTWIIPSIFDIFRIQIDAPTSIHPAESG